jgi:hypothetical protein
VQAVGELMSRVQARIQAGLEKNPVFFLTSPVGFLGGFFWVGFLGGFFIANPA